MKGKGGPSCSSGSPFGGGERREERRNELHKTDLGLELEGDDHQ